MPTKTHFLASLLLSTVIVQPSFADDASTAQQPTKKSPPSGFESIFDGETLDGWHARPHFSPIKLAEMSEEERAEKMSTWMSEAKEHWTTENGELINDGKGPYLVTNKDYRDYELLIEYKTVPLADSGIYLKANPQVQIWDYTEERKFDKGADLGSGGLWNNAPGAPGKDPAVLADREFGQWNEFRIQQIGARTSVWLNGKQVVDHAIMHNYWDRQSPLFPEGPIELQTHGGEIRWRNIFLREIPTEEANEILRSKDESQFAQVFNGQDLTGWQGKTDDYEVIDGAIRCKPKHGGLLVTEKEYANFVARVEFKLPPGGNNGLAIRSPLNGNAAYAAMTELQILDTEHPKYESIDPRQAHGSVYGMIPAHRGFLRESGQWNFQEVTVDGSRITVELNGNVILDADVAEVKEFMNDKPHPGKDRKSGFFGFAGHNDPVEFRYVAIKELPASESEASE